MRNVYLLLQLTKAESALGHERRRIADLEDQLRRLTHENEIHKSSILELTAQNQALVAASGHIKGLNIGGNDHAESGLTTITYDHISNDESNSRACVNRDLNLVAEVESKWKRRMEELQAQHEAERTAALELTARRERMMEGQWDEARRKYGSEMDAARAQLESQRLELVAFQARAEKMEQLIHYLESLAVRNMSLPPSSSSSSPSPLSSSSPLS
eukprot:CAMPEP_0175039954 /NCGR_PEP_ID=MMETSP0052_2-20121109/942_1 /TAXON_ID=51329 ORGANISM="Polytomella parva, Strain SAG 63-3" /NCGR_SAMPLE_ID=MMETSP0052_2 /ASSEMBLY_ACC=CAM_ASM_000194 /LENGTH=214 /DNA_ID=CAMNT_0016302007 /DNA_START=244 /DNA_END=884 /DNA_ORIENTATION=+